jgi:small nuclear ribonucleoprotein (snRNP)-like protein
MSPNNVMIGVFVGVITISMFTPLLSLYGFNQTTSLILLYSLPFVGAASIFVADALQPGSSTVPSRSGEKEKENPGSHGHLSGILGKTITLHTRMGGSYRGSVRGVDNEMLILGNAVRLDVPNGNKLDHLFIDKDDIKRIESPSGRIIGEFS